MRYLLKDLTTLTKVLDEHYRTGVSLKEAYYRVVKDPFSIPTHRARAVHRRLMELGKRKGLCEDIIDDVVRSADFEDLHPTVKAVLVAAADEMVFEEEPPALVTDAAVKTVKELMGEGPVPFVHAVCHDLEDYDLERLKDKGYDDVCLKHHFPPEFVDKLREVVDEDELEDLLEALNSPATKYVRVNTLRADVEDVREMLEDEGVDTEPTPLPDVLRIVREEVPVVRTGVWREGLVFTQDLASAAVAHVLEPEPGSFVIDLCAAPGGKTTHIACLMEGEGRILAVDASDWRLEAMKEKLEWQGIPEDLVEIMHADARDLPEELGEEVADAVLVDPPCSGMGSVQKRPEMRWNLSRKSIRKYAKLQHELLKSAVRLVKPGGVVVYSTCTMSVEENEGVVRRVLRAFDDVSLEEVRLPFGRSGKLPGTRRFYPHVDDCQGFFIAKLKKG